MGADTQPSMLCMAGDNRYFSVVSGVSQETQNIILFTGRRKLTQSDNLMEITHRPI